MGKGGRFIDATFISAEAYIPLTTPLPIRVHLRLSAVKNI
jgi:hypothetical protein